MKNILQFLALVGLIILVWLVQTNSFISNLWDKYWIKPLNIFDGWFYENDWHRVVVVLVCMLIMAAFVAGLWLRDKIKRR
ncbi:hypothetical protein M0R04_12010 [Candidatus Dojkabacteria bacterium]|nr:hypothetical protein [Candidatus Dojkabacteria bacterium]